MNAQRVVHLFGALLLMAAPSRVAAQPPSSVKPAAQPATRAGPSAPLGSPAQAARPNATAAKPPKEARPPWVRKADKGFFDDPLALHPTLNLVALIRTDSASFANVELFDLIKKNKLAGFPLGDPQQVFEHLVFTGADRSLLVVVKDGKSGQRTAQRFDHEGKPAGLLGPATDIGFTGDGRYLVRWDRIQDKKGNQQFTVSVHELRDFSPVGKPHVFTADAKDNVVKPVLKVLAWLDGYSRIFGQEPGAYDKAKDLRLPGRAAVYDVLRGDFIARHDIDDLMAWEAANQLRRRRPGRSAFADIPEDESKLQLVDGSGRRTTLELAIPFESYNLRSLLEQETEDRLYFSLTVDPMNPDALGRKKADVPKLDLYRVALPQPGSLRDVASRAADHLIRVPMDERPVKWTVAGSWMVVLRKSQNFARGTQVIEVYRLS